MGRSTRGIARRAVRLSEELAAKALRSGVGGHFVAERIRRPRRKPDGTGHFLAGDGASRRTSDGECPGPWNYRANDHRIRHRSAEKTLSQENPERRRNLVPGIFRAECRLRSRELANRGAARRQPLHRQRPEGMDQLRLGSRLVRACGAHGSECSETQGPHRSDGGYENARRGRAPAAADDRRDRIQRSVFPRRARAGGKRGRQSERRMGRRHRHADA